MVEALASSKAMIGSAAADDRVCVMQLDLSDLNSVREFAQSFEQRFDRLDLLIANAGIMAPLT